MQILHEKGVKTPQDISLMIVPSAINAQTIIRNRVCLSSDEEVDDPEQALPMDTETEVGGQPPSSQRSGGRGRNKASLSSSVL